MDQNPAPSGPAGFGGFDPSKVKLKHVDRSEPHSHAPATQSPPATYTPPVAQSPKPVPAQSIATSGPLSPPPTSQPPSPPPPAKKMAKAQWDFPGTGEGGSQLPLKAGEEVEVLSVAGDWWLGLKPSGQKGYFPGNFVVKVGAWE